MVAEHVLIQGKDSFLLATKRASWLGFNGDSERLQEKYKDEKSNYGELAWKEINERLARIYDDKEAKRILDEAEIVVKNYYEKTKDLGPQQKSYYHGIGDVKSADGHPNQVMIGSAREMIGALKLEELTKNSFDLEKFGMVLQAMAVHDFDWDLKRLDKAEIGLKPATAQLIISMVNYNNHNESKPDYQGLKYKGWAEEEIEIIKTIVRRNDLLQVADKNYFNNGRALFADFLLHHPEYLSRWNDEENVSQTIVPDNEFYEFVKDKVIGSERNPWRYYRKFFEVNKKCLAEQSWRVFEQRVLNKSG